VDPRNVSHGSRPFLVAIYCLDGATYCKRCSREVLDRCLAVLPQGKTPLETYKHCRSLGTIKPCRLCARPISVSGFVSEAPAADPARCLRRCLFRPPRRTPTRKRCTGRSSRTAFRDVIVRLWTRSEALWYRRIYLRYIWICRINFSISGGWRQRNHFEHRQSMQIVVRPSRERTYPDCIGMHSALPKLIAVAKEGRGCFTRHLFQDYRAGVH
jgi:hypothetical protein